MKTCYYFYVMQETVTQDTCSKVESHCLNSRKIDIGLKNTQKLTPRKKTSKFSYTRPQLTPSKNVLSRTWWSYLVVVLGGCTWSNFSYLVALEPTWLYLVVLVQTTFWFLLHFEEVPGLKYFLFLQVKLWVNSECRRQPVWVKFIFLNARLQWRDLMDGLLAVVYVELH